MRVARSRSRSAAVAGQDFHLRSEFLFPFDPCSLQLLHRDFSSVSRWMTNDSAPQIKIAKTRAEKIKNAPLFGYR
ncbi:unnamed protein product [Linum tenue]|uniref:Uncharacterized protein n=1 Tax=Linum tenue TaxID=586396 RepID=A0AAV0I9I0_9ROSI|nr:unnamed protein product [Linum tenue]